MVCRLFRKVSDFHSPTPEFGELAEMHSSPDNAALSYLATRAGSFDPEFQVSSSIFQVSKNLNHET